VTSAPGRSRRLAALLASSLAALLTGCETAGYYAQAAGGHLALMASRQPIDELLTVPAGEQPAARADVLRTVLEIREFATAELGLPDNGSYRSTTPPQGDAVVWSVVATPRYSLEPRRWCFPVAGCTSYRGYFDRAAADGYARGLAREGLDVTVDPVPAYSTLGWFDDPLPGNVLRWPDYEIATLVFHELAHQRLYVKGDSPFNEAFATAVADAGVGRWLARRGDAAATAGWRGARQRQAQFLGLLLGARERLLAGYEGAGSDEVRESLKRDTFAALREDYARLTASWEAPSPGYDAWMARPLNNARLAAVATYRRWLPAFDHLMHCAGGDFERFYAACEALAVLDATRREAELERLAALPAGASCGN
jgi:predicted aminopeptidase